MDPLGRRRFVLLGLAASAMGCTKRQDTVARPPAVPRVPKHADALVRGGTILTLDPDRPRVAALAIHAGVIVAAGDADDLAGWIGPSTRIHELEGGTATPGLVDAHAHLVGLGHSLQQVDLRGADSIERVVQRLREHAPPSGWITGRGWDQNLWGDAAMPTHRPLSEAFPDRPVWLRRVDGHAGWANRALLEAASIDRNTPVPAGGEILRDDTGEPTGVLVDAAMGLVPVPPAGSAEIRRAILDGQAHAAARGLTGVHEMGLGPAEDAVYRELAAAGDAQARLKLRVHGYAHEGWFLRELSAAAPDPILPEARYVLAGVKVYADGALGSRGAALLEDYADRPKHRGLLQHDDEAMFALVRSALQGGWQVATHAIGDAANRMVLDNYARALAEISTVDRRLRIEHCQIVHPDDVLRFAELGLVASMQPTHATSDMQWVPDRIGEERLPRAYAWRRFLDAGVRLAFGSDFPVELVDVTHGLHAAVTRQDALGHPAGGWLADQRLTLLEALGAFTEGSAHASHRDGHLGRLVPGYRADLTCFAKSLEQLAPPELRDAKIRGTIVDGEAVYWA
jgi:predicted amidohydrolase YtcJ